ncbi:hypothetical protein Taro_029091 [Colocasia esculenta]|uniref:Uncharacterized protein n=1 Tax=Colocasia esculenta TaxID=4460 RepID=A0A843VI43_COLES|nr:hypothetical protein [Colocasia esculenta]
MAYTRPSLLHSDAPSSLIAAATVHMALANPATASQWLEKVAPHRHPRETGCWRRPWVCQEEGGRFLPFGRKACCSNHCVDVSSDVNSCGACGTCCNGVCIDPKTNPLHFGACNNRCAMGSICSHDMCGYAQQQHRFPQPCKHSPPLAPPQKYPSRP